MSKANTVRAGSAGVWLGPPLDAAELRRIERHLHLHCHKWDTQIGDTSVLSEQAVIVTGTEWDWLCRTAEALAAETLALESCVVDSPRLQSLLGIPEELRSLLDSRGGTRTMRFDFHPTEEGWRVSEVNSDVPGGWSEGTFLNELYQPFHQDLDLPPSPLNAWGGAIEPIAAEGAVALLCAPGFLEDEQVVRTFAAVLGQRGIPHVTIQSPAAVEWRDGNCFARRSGRAISCVIRFFQAEWLCSLPPAFGWKRLLEWRNVVNPAAAAISESKRFPLLFDEARDCRTWRESMPECRDPRDVAEGGWDDWVLKASYSNTGDSVYIRGTMEPGAWRRTVRAALRSPDSWVAQRRFVTCPVESRRGPLHPCIGVFTVNGRAAGAYCRLSGGQVTSASAKEAPLFIDRRL